HIHDHVTQIRGSWQRTVDAAARLRARNVPVVLKSPVMSLNIDGIDGMAREAERLGCHHQLDPKVTTREDGDASPLAHRMADDALRAFYNARWPDGEPPPGNPDLDETPCRAGRDVCGINPQGLVSACHSIPIFGGDLRKQSFRAIWRGSDEIRRVREL